MDNSVFKTGREAFTRAHKQYNLKSSAPLSFYLFTMRKKLNPYSRDNGLRELWNSGWNTGLRGIK